jgi:hypothetical protein
VSVSGTNNTVVKFTSTSTIGNSQIFDNGTNIGIFTSSPTGSAATNLVQIAGGSAVLRIGPQFATSDRDYIELIANGTNTQIVSPNETFTLQNLAGTIVLQTATTHITGALGVGTATPTTVGLIRATNDVIAYYGSDSRLKENVETITGSLDILSKINGYRFDWIPMEGIHENEGRDVGVIAQEIESVLPELVTTRDNGFKAVKYEKIVALLIQTNKELLKRIEALEEKMK